MMGSAEHAYLTDGNAVGFAKPYADGAYAFVALLPNEGVSLEDYIAGLDGTGFRAMMANAQSAEVEAYLPKFEVEQSLELANIVPRAHGHGRRLRRQRRRFLRHVRRGG